MTPDHVARWARLHLLGPVHVDCTTAVMLKILDGKCKMAAEEKRVMAWLYDEVKGRPGNLLGDEIHRLIGESRGELDDQRRNAIYEKRVLAETMISRPVMKGFKAMIREQGLFES